MERGRTIGHLAREVGLPTSTIRYYEREGLIAAPDRSGGNYRLYDGEAAGRLRFIRAAQATGFTLAEIRTLLRCRDGSLPAGSDLRELIERRLEAVHRRQSDLRHVQGVLESFLEVCAETGPREAGQPAESPGPAEPPA